MRTLKVLFFIGLILSLGLIAGEPRDLGNHPGDSVLKVVVDNPTDTDKRSAGAAVLCLGLILLISTLQANNKRWLVQENDRLKEEAASTGFLLGKTGQTTNELRRAIEKLEEGSPAYDLASQQLALQKQVELVKSLEAAMESNDERARLIREFAAQQSALKRRIEKLQAAKTSMDAALTAADETDDEIRDSLKNLEDEGDEDAKAKYNRINGYFADHEASIEAAEKLVGPAEELKAKFEDLKARAAALDDNDTGIYGTFQAIDALKEEIGNILDNIEKDSEGNSLEDNIGTYREDLEKLAERVNNVDDARSQLIDLLAEVTKLVKPEDEATPPESEGKKA